MAVSLDIEDFNFGSIPESLLLIATPVPLTIGASVASGGPITSTFTDSLVWKTILAAYPTASFDKTEFLFEDFNFDSSSVADSSDFADFPRLIGIFDGKSSRLQGTVTLFFKDDNLDEPNEAFSLQPILSELDIKDGSGQSLSQLDSNGIAALFASVGGLTVTGRIRGTIIDDDPPPNTPPVANNDSASTNENTAINIAVASLLANDTDANNDPLTITGVSNLQNGTAVLNDNGTPTNTADDYVTFTPTTGFTGNASFNYTISDGKSGSSTATVGLTVNAVNTPPVAGADKVNTQQNTPLTITTAALLANDSDANGDSLKITDVKNGTGGTVVLNDNGTPADSSDDTITFTPSGDFTGNASFSYTLSDGQDTTTGTVTVGVAAVAGLNLSEGNGNDTLNGDVGKDTLSGGNGNDTLNGGAGADILNGDNGDDLLNGGAGNDTLTGGNGNDRFVIASGAGTDTITDFKKGTDLIALSGNLSFSNLSFSGNTILLKGSTDVLAILSGVNTTTLTAANFTTV